jgi:hypothetical protein
MDIIVWYSGQPSAIRPDVAQQFGITRTVNLTDNPKLYEQIMNTQNAGKVVCEEDVCTICSS